MRKAQGSMEYLLILAAILAIAVIVVIILNSLLAPAEDANIITHDKYQAALIGIEFIGYDQVYEPGNPVTVPELIVIDGDEYELVEGDPTGLGDPVATIIGSGGSGHDVYIDDSTDQAIIDNTGGTTTCTLATTCPGVAWGTCTSGTQSRSCDDGCGGTAVETQPCCTDECPTDGELRCHGTGSDTCTDHDMDGCLEWGYADTGCDGGYSCVGSVCVEDICSNNVQEGDELCDGTDLAGMTCDDFPGYTIPGLACLSDCTGFDTSGCTVQQTTVPAGWTGIYDWVDLDTLIRADSTADYILMNDLDTTTAGYGTYVSDPAEGWLPLPTFTGTLDGNGYTITGLNIDRSGTTNVGLFSVLGVDAELINVHLEGVDIVGADQVGGLVGNNMGGSITHSYATGAVSGMGIKVGGLVGFNWATITNSYSTGAVSGTDYVGGLVGFNNGGTITDSYATGAVSGMGIKVGGLVGRNGGTITDSYATGAVSGTEYVGGLVGSMDISGTITDSYATGTVSGTDNSVGGLVGANYGTITNSYATSTLSGSANSVGGLVGFNQGSITKSYATGAVGGNNWVGGLVGFNQGSITKSYATGTVSAAGSPGGLVGYDLNSAATYSYWDKDTTGQTTSAGGTGFTTPEMTYNYVGVDVSNDAAGPYYLWDFTVTGDWEHNTTGGYPILR